jgi:LysR family transcriptional regulator, low CO2-responsive transcriptional regulator
MQNLTLRQLETVREVSRCGTMIKAAKALCVTPAALTSRVKLLEEDLGLQLFERSEGRLRLTEAGKEVIAAAARIDNVLSDLLGTLQGTNGMLGGRIRIGVVSTAKYFAPRLIAAFMKQHPAVDLRLSIHNRRDIVSMLCDYEIDIALMGRPPDDFSVKSEPIGPHPHVIIAPPDHPLAGKARISKTELSTQNFIVREEGSGTRSMFDYFFSGLAMRSHKVRIEIGSNETIKQAVMAGLGISLISAHTIEAEIASGRLVVLKMEGLPIMRKWFAIQRADRVLSRPGQAMWTFMVNKGADFLPQVGVG